MRFTFILSFLVGIGFAPAQTLTTKAAKVVLIVDSRSNDVTDIMLFSTLQKMDKEWVSKKYGNHKFYVGLLQGNYETSGSHIVPKEDTIIIMYTEKQLFPEGYFFPSENLSPGDSFEIGKTKTKVVSNKKGELTVRI